MRRSCFSLEREKSRFAVTSTRRALACLIAFSLVLGFIYVVVVANRMADRVSDLVGAQRAPFAATIPVAQKISGRVV